MSRTAQMTPMLRHYSEVKAKYADAVVLYRMGDFYEVFFDDAVEVAPVLEVTLTARHRGKESETAMCGVPHHALEVYLAKLIKAGYKVAICEQVEDPAEAKGLVKREVTRVVTPGTVSEPELLEGKEENLLAALAWGPDGGGGAFLDISTGSFFARRWSTEEEALQDLRLSNPREVVMTEDVPAALSTWARVSDLCTTTVPDVTWFDPARTAETLQRHFATESLRAFGLEDKGSDPTVSAAALALSYGRETQQNDLSHINKIVVRENADRMQLDATTVANLELFGNARTGGRTGSLFGVLDRTVTAPASRLLKAWLRRPLHSIAEIEDRQLAVTELLEAEEARRRIREHLREVGDPARLLSRAVLGSLKPKEAETLRSSLVASPTVLAELIGLEGQLLASVRDTDPLADLCGELERVLAPEPGVSLQKGGVIAEGVDPELDRCRSLARDSKTHLAALETKEREATGISSLKIRYNKVFGYYLEVTKANQARVPERYTRKQTLVNAERYVTDELKELEVQILEAESKQLELEAHHFERLLQTIVDAKARLAALAEALAVVDVLAALADVSARNGYCRPQMRPAGEPMAIQAGRHPVVEKITSGTFVPNDLELGAENGDIVLLTGPNMGGKSTYLRQCALIVLLAHTGSFVPAEKAEIALVDRIFTRVGASDDLSRGESTFMIEMIETANILHNATAESLVILDEVGRGTATFDGLSLAWATVEYLHEKLGTKALFATHYHELTELAALFPGVVNRTMTVKEWEDRIVFLHQVVPGSADKSYGLHVARLAGMPEGVVDRAARVLANLEQQEYDITGKPRLAADPEGEAAGDDLVGQMGLFAPADELVASILRDVDVDRLSPLAALNLIQSLKSRLGG